MLDIKFVLDDEIEEAIVKAIVKRDGLAETVEGYGEAYETMIRTIHEYSSIDAYYDARADFAEELGIDYDAFFED